MKIYSEKDLAKTRKKIATEAKKVIGKKFNITISRKPAK